MKNYDVKDFFNHYIVKEDLPQTIFLFNRTDTIDIKHAYYNSFNQLHNRYFCANKSFLYPNKTFFPEIKNLFGLEIKMITVFYPPYTYYKHVVSIYFNSQ